MAGHDEDEVTERENAKISPIKVPSMTYRFGGYIGLQPGPGRAIYRLLSAYAHGKQWKGLTTKIQAVEEATARTSTNSFTPAFSSSSSTALAGVCS